jgi:hypothetical protein
MQVLSNNYGQRTRVYRPYINREESSLNVSVFVPESSVNTGLYTIEPVDHLTGNSPAGTFVQQADSANYWWGMTPYNKVTPKNDLYTIQPHIYSNPTDFQSHNYSASPYRNMGNAYGGKAYVGHQSRVHASYGGM